MSIVDQRGSISPERIAEIRTILADPEWPDTLDMARCAHDLLVAFDELMVVSEARDGANTKFIRGLADMHTAARAEAVQLRAVVEALADVDSYFSSEHRRHDADGRLLDVVLHREKFDSLQRMARAALHEDPDG